MSKRGNLALFFLFLVVSPLGWASQQHQQQQGHRPGVGSQEQDSFGQQQRQQRQQSGSQEDDDQQQRSSTNKAKRFRPGYEYSFTYNGQISTGLNQDPSASGNPPQQKSAARMQAQVKILFQSESHAQLRLQNIRIGHMNDRIQNPEQVQPMGMFEPKQIDSNKLRQLQQPCEFTYKEGVVQRINFQQQEGAWSKNIKRSILNLIQLNLKRNNAQGLRSAEELSAGPQSDKLPQQQQEQLEELEQQLGATMAFTLPEVTIEGECQTTYIVNQDQQQQGRQDSSSESSSAEKQQGSSSSSQRRFNVTKSINFKQCKKIADVAYGYQTQQQQPQCAQCQQQWAKQQQQQGQQGAGGSQQQQQRQQQMSPHPCDQCDPKEVKEQKLDRTTVLRFVLNGKPQGSYGIQRAELISQYTYKELRSQTGEYGAAMQAIVACELVFKGQQRKEGQQQQQQRQHSSSSQQQQQQAETLLYDNEWDTEEKRFYMFGDDEYPGNKNPFNSVDSAVKREKIQSMVQEMAAAASDKQKGIEVFETTQMQPLVELMRMCTQEELKQVLKALANSQSQHSPNSNQAEKQKRNEIFADALAAAGTRNTIKVLISMIPQQQLTPNQAAKALKGLSGLPAPSDAQVDEVMNLCRNEVSNRNTALKQSCWLTFGSMVGELCLHKTQKAAQQSAFGAQSGFNKEEICPLHKKEMYKKEMIQLYDQAETTYEKVLALKALGNAGIDIAVNKLEQIIRDQSEERICRVQAIDALRRLRTQMPRKIQRVLLPVFQQQSEHPEIRMAAFSMMMATQPEQPIVDQVSYTLTKERSQQVQSFVYTTMKALAKSEVSCQQELAKHLKNALKLANIDEQSLGGSRQYQVPIYSQEEKEGAFLKLVSVFGSRGMLPTHLAAQLNTMLNDEYTVNSVKVGMIQRDMDQWYEKLVQSLQKGSRSRRGGQQQSSSEEGQQQSRTRGQRSTDNQQQRPHGSQQLDSIFKTLKIKSRSRYSDSNEQQQQDNYSGQQGQQRRGRGSRHQPFAMINVRIGDVDRVVIPVDKKHAPEALKRMLQGEKPSMAGLWGSPEEQQRGNHFRSTIALNMGEQSAKIPTSMGVPLRVLSATSALISIDGGAKMSHDQNGQTKVDLRLHPIATIAHQQRMEAWMCGNSFATGVESIAGMEVNVPIELELRRSDNCGSQQQQSECMSGAQIDVKLPKQKTRLFGIHTVPGTYVRQTNPKTKLPKDPLVKTIHDEQLEQLQQDVNSVKGEHTFGMPVRVQGHYHSPSSPADYKQMIQLLCATDNRVHITFEPKEGTPSAIRIHASGELFKKISPQQQQQSGYNANKLNDFYSNSVRFEHAYPQDFADMELEDHTQRRSKLTNFISNFQPKGPIYQHQLKTNVETMGGNKKLKGSCQLKASCDSRLSFCKAETTVKRSPIYAGEQQQWVLESKVQVLTPETVNSVSQLPQLEQKQKRFVCQAETEWGPQQGRKQSINLRIQGEQAKTQQWRKLIEQGGRRSSGSSSESNSQGNSQQGKQQQAKYYQKRTAFLNKFDMAAEYKLQPQMQQTCQRGLEMLKSYNFWTTEVMLNQQQRGSQEQQQQQQQQGSQRQGTVHATLVIDPITQQHCNISVKTATESIRIKSVQLPTHMRPFPLVRMQGQRGTHRVSQLFPGLSVVQGRAECKVDGRKVDTFDNVLYKAPISKKCYSVLAKDCSSDQPKFAVKMKALACDQQDGDCQQQSSSQQDKKIRVITRDTIIECKPQQQQQQGGQQQQRQGQKLKKLQCTVDGQTVQPQEQNSGEEQPVECDDSQTMCTINVPGVQVRFNGKKAWIKLSKLYKETQCGLCGHYDDNADDELRMNNNEKTTDLVQFHRSFSVGSNDEECSPNDQQDFYQKQKDDFSMESQEFQQRRRSGGSNWPDDDQSQDQSRAYSSESQQQRDSRQQQDDDDQEDQDDESWWGPSKRSKGRWPNSNSGRQNQQQRRRQNQNQRQQQGQQGQQHRHQGQRSSEETEEPVMRTKVMEYSTKICFSVEPVQQCPDGTVPVENRQRQQQQQNNDYSSSEENNQQQQQSNQQQGKQSQQKGGKRMPFICLPRSSPEARRLQRQARRGVIIQEDIQQHQPSFVEQVKVPSKCIRY